VVERIPGLALSLIQCDLEKTRSVSLALSRRRGFLPLRTTVRGASAYVRLVDPQRQVVIVPTLERVCHETVIHVCLASETSAQCLKGREREGAEQPTRVPGGSP
jgi:hypothetical protein